MHVGQFLFYNTYIPPSIRVLVDKYYSTIQNNEKTIFKDKLESKTDTKDIPRRDILFNYLINDDIQLAANSSYITLSDLFNLNEAGSLVDKGISTMGAVSGTVSQQHSNYRNMFNYSLWEKTEPMNINIKITLYSKTDPLIDVMIPTYIIMSHAGLDKFTENNKDFYAVPGISFFMSMYLYKKAKFELRLAETEALNGYGTVTTGQDTDGFTFYQYSHSKQDPSNKKLSGPSVKKYTSQGNEAYTGSTPFNSKLFSLLIDGLVYLDKAYIKSVSATFSKHTAKSAESTFTGDFPIWTELDVQIESIVPAISSMLWDSLTNKGFNILNQKRAGS
jgi:hypothetical protein